MATTVNGLLSPPQTEKAPSTTSSPPRIVLAGKTGRILCVADIRGDYHELNRLIREHDATAVIHTGDFGFLDADSLGRMNDPILRHLIQYSPLVAPATRTQLLSATPEKPRDQLIADLNNSSIHFPLSQFPHLLSGAITFPVPVFTVYGLIEDVHIVEKFRTGEYEVQNLTVIDEASTALIETGGLKLRLLGLGGALAFHKLFDHGEGKATIAGARGTMWVTALQLGELVETAQRSFDPSETRLFISASPVPRHGLLGLLANAIKADLTISGGTHFRYSASFNAFTSHLDFDSYRSTLLTGQKGFMEIYNSVKEKVDASLNEEQQSLLKKALTAVDSLPDKQDDRWMNIWNWVLTDAAGGHLLFSISGSRVSVETRSSGLNFAHRTSQAQAPPSAPYTPAPTSAVPSRPVQDVTKSAFPRPTPAPAGIPPRPVQQLAPQSNSIRGIAARPPQATSIAARPVPSGPATVASNGLPSVPSKPPVQPRSFRGQPPVTPGSKSTEPQIKPTEASATKSPAPGPTTKTVTPTLQANGKPPAPTAPAANAKKDDRSKSASTKRGEVNGATANGIKEEKKDNEKKDAEKRDGEKKDFEKEKSKPSDSEKPMDKAASTEKIDVAPESRALPKKTMSLYIKGIPVPTSEDEIKALFPNSSKISHVKIIVDHVSGTQKDFAYADFESEADMQTALSESTKVIRDTTVSISVSNPPARGPFGSRGGRGGFRGGSRGGSRPGFSDRKESAKAE